MDNSNHFILVSRTHDGHIWVLVLYLLDCPGGYLGSNLPPSMSYAVHSGFSASKVRCDPSAPASGHQRHSTIHSSNTSPASVSSESSFTKPPRDQKRVRVVKRSEEDSHQLGIYTHVCLCARAASPSREPACPSGGLRPTVARRNIPWLDILPLGNSFQTTRKTEDC